MKPLIFLIFSLFLTAYFAQATPRPAQAGPLKNAELLHLSSAQQEVWVKGVFDALGHLAYQSDQERAACIWRWLEDPRGVRVEFLLEYFEKNPTQNPTTTILILLKNDCHLSV